MKQKHYIAGLYYRLSQEDERQGESVSIDNQRTMLRKYAEEHGFEIHGEYIDDGVSGTTFDRPEVQRLLDDAKTGVINTIIVKDLSRFGRNYIEVGQYVDYVFPAFGIRFIAIQDNVDTENRDSGAMEMMPIMNVFNEWHAANTSKKIRTVLKANAREGKYHARKAPYGYVKSDTEKKTPIIDEEAAAVVKRIFEMRASGLSPHKIADILNAEGILNPSRYSMEKYGIVGRKENMGLWSFCAVNSILNNPTYLGHMAQQRWSSVSYKNHKRYKKDESEWVVVHNTHEPNISKDDCAELMRYFQNRGPLSKALSLSKQVLDSADKTRGSYLSTMFDKLNIFADLSLCSLTSANEITFSDMAEKPIYDAEVSDERQDNKRNIGHDRLSEQFQGLYVRLEQ